MPLTPGLIQPLELGFPHLPPALDGQRIVHLTDLHVRRPQRRHARLARQLADQPCDLLLLTGDYMENRGHEAAAFQTLAQLLKNVHPRLGTYGIFGNHDTPAFRRQAPDLPVHWLVNDTARPDAALDLWGLDTHAKTDHEGADSVALLRRRPPVPRPTDADGDTPERPLRIMLAHSPAHLTVAADLGADLVLSGHTHGGQCRLPTGQALINACDMPLHLVAGVLRHRDTLAAVSRGIGHSSRVPRVFCPPHVPVYTLRRRPMAGRFTLGIDNIQPW